MADVFSSFVLSFRDAASPGIRGVTAEIQKQRDAVQTLKREEQLRSLEQRKALNATREQLAANRLATLRNTPGTSSDSVLAAELRLRSIKERSLSIDKQIGIQSQTNALRLAESAAKAKQLTGGLGESLSAANLLSGAIGLGITGAIAVATAAVQLFTQQMGTAITASEAVIPNATAISREFAISRDRSRELVVEQQKLVEVLGRDLPVSIGDINSALSLAQNSGIAKLAGGDINLYQESVIGDTQDLGLIPLATILRKQLGATITDIQFQQAIGAISNPDAKVGDLNRLEFVRSSGLGAELKKRDFDEAKSATDRLKIYLEAFRTLVPPEAIAEQRQTISALTSQFTDTLFADRTGIFGFLRDLEPTLAGDQTIFDEAKKTVDLILGKGGLFETLGELTGDYDPLISLRNSIRGFNEFLGLLNTTLDQLSNIPGISGLVQKILELSQYIGSSGGVGAAVVRGGVDGVRSLFGAKYRGDYISAASGFNSAMNSEIANKPPGTSIVIANSSETVLTPFQLKQLRDNEFNKGINTAQPVSRSVVIERGAVQIVAQAGQSPEAIAERVIEQLNNLMRAEENTLYDF